MARPELLTAPQTEKLARRWVETKVCDRKELLNEFSVSRVTFYRAMKRFGIVLQKQVCMI